MSQKDESYEMVRVHMSCSCLHDSVGGVLARIQAVPYLCKLFPKYNINVGHITCSIKLHVGQIYISDQIIYSVKFHVGSNYWWGQITSRVNLHAGLNYFCGQIIGRVKIVLMKSHFRWIFWTGSGPGTYFNAWFFF